MREANDKEAWPPPSSFRYVATIAPDKERQLDFFAADIVDAAPKDDLASMEHPLFALKPGDHSIRRYNRNGLFIEIQPSAKGSATIHDKDVWLYCISQLVESLNRGRQDASRVVHFTAYDFLKATHRGTSGRSYERLGAALERLRGTSIVTNIATAGKRERNGFGLIDAWRIIEHDHRQHMAAISVTLPDWLWRAVQAKQVLTLNREYFRLRKPLDRRIYELVRKHCGTQPKWRVSLGVLHHKSGSAASLREFRRAVKLLAVHQGLPDYRISWHEAEDAITFYAPGKKGHLAEIADLVQNRKNKRPLGL